MSSKSNIYCCVPGCTQKGTVDQEGNRVGFFGLPNDQNLRQQWLVKKDTARCLSPQEQQTYVQTRETD